MGSKKDGEILVSYSVEIMQMNQNTLPFSIKDRNVNIHVELEYLR